ncbi:MAG TPA: type II toxin-antitoxin system HicB family antitoxin [Acidobacteriota bacterium]|nr:type II toxin-antitoxin system HicB family antitoxin [Acidobacteriota bacterium]
MDKHAVSIKWSDEDNGFIATIPKIKGLSAVGATREQALSELHIAAQAYFEAFKESGKPLPPPEKITTYSGQLRVRMPKSLHAALSGEAEDENISLNTYIVALLSERHIEKKLLNQLNVLESLHKKTKAEKPPNFGKSVHMAHKIKEKDLKYREKKRKK